MTLRSVLCAVLGGHQWQGPRLIEGRLRLVCALGCGALSSGIETLGQERARQQQARRVVGFVPGSRRGEQRRVA